MNVSPRRGSRDADQFGQVPNEMNTKRIQITNDFSSKVHLLAYKLVPVMTTTHLKVHTLIGLTRLALHKGAAQPTQMRAFNVTSNLLEYFLTLFWGISSRTLTISPPMWPETITNLHQNTTAAPLLISVYIKQSHEHEWEGVDSSLRDARDVKVPREGVQGQPSHLNSPKSSTNRYSIRSTVGPRPSGLMPAGPMPCLSVSDAATCPR